MLRLDFTRADLNLPEALAATRRASISGVQDKVQLRRKRGGFAWLKALSASAKELYLKHFMDRLRARCTVNHLISFTKTERIPLW